jgi:type VI secretion system secreted protein VgrG
VIEQLLQQLIERLDNRYYGKYRGYVSNVTDPQNIGRIKTYVPRLLGEAETGWAMPCTPYAGPDQGLYAIPEVGAGVWVEFEHYPERIVEPGVRILKSATGHYILLDDRAETARVEIRDSLGNRIILSDEGLQILVSNETTINEGNQTTEVDSDVTLRVGGGIEEEVHGSVKRTVDGDVSLRVKGGYTERFDVAGYTRTIDHNGVSETFTGPKSDNVRGDYQQRISGAVSQTAMGGFGLTAGGNVQLASSKAVKLAATMPDMPGPSINAVSIDALGGNVSINTMLGMCQIGGMSAISPMVLGDGLAIHFTVLAQILKIVNPLTVAAYGPALDAWAALTPLMDWSMFGFVKRFPFGP